MEAHRFAKTSVGFNLLNLPVNVFFANNHEIIASGDFTKYSSSPIRFWKLVFGNENRHFKPTLVRQTIVTWVHETGGVSKKALAALLYHSPETQDAWYNFGLVKRNLDTLVSVSCFCLNGQKWFFN